MFIINVGLGLIFEGGDSEADETDITNFVITAVVI